MSINEAMRKIDTGREYNLSHIRDEGLFPWTRDIRTIRKMVHRDYWGENLLKALVSGAGRALEYKIKGANIIRFIEKYGPGLMMATAGSNKHARKLKGDSASSGRKS
jgi:hypothetical protein